MKSKTKEEIQEAIDLQNGYCTLGFWSRNFEICQKPNWSQIELMLLRIEEAIQRKMELQCQLILL